MRLYLHERAQALRAPMAHNGSRLIRHGKYKRLTFDALAAADKDYVSWCLRAPSLPSSLREFARYVKERHGGLLMAGKYKHMFFADVLEFHPDYAAPRAQMRGTQLSE